MPKPITLPIKMSEATYWQHVEDQEGICINCGEAHGSCEPDARGYPCDSCRRNDVYGIEELLVLGKIEITTSRKRGPKP